jgi:hypothetical protein
MSQQIGLLRILASHQDGFATSRSIRADLTLLTCEEWDRRLRALHRLAPDLNVLTSGLVLPDRDGWRITDAGRAFLAELERRQLQFPGDEPASALDLVA